MAGPADCYEAVGELDAVMRAHLGEGQNYYVLGGIASGALVDDGAKIDHEGQRVVASADSALPVVRDNGTPRDVDILIGDICDDAQLRAMHDDVRTATGGALLVSLFGLDEHVPLNAMKPAERLEVAAKSWISRRTWDEEVHRYVLNPLEVVVPAASYDPWKLVTPQGREVSMLHPVGHTYAYVMRSISGLRPKDQEKYRAMAETVFSDEAFVAEAFEGKFASWAAFARAITHARRGELRPDDDWCVARGATRAELAAFRWKSRFLRAMETNPTIVRVAQSEIGQKALSGFVGTK